MLSHLPLPLPLPLPNNVSQLTRKLTGQVAEALSSPAHSAIAMSSAFVSKSKRVRFELTLRILDLNNVPLVTGTSFIKWHLPSSSAAEHRGRTNKCPIRDHRVHYDYEKQVAVRLNVGKDGMLEECLIHFEVEQEYSSSGRGERIKLGEIHLNLAEYADAALELPSSPGAGPTDEEGGITRRYLMQESKINSTLKIGIRMRHLEGTRDYYAPPLRTAPVFGGIAGIISSSEANSSTPGIGSHTPNTEDGESGGVGTIPQSFSINNKEMGEMQDMYRRTLAAFWTSQPGELKADECIEDLFSGGDGWGKGGRPTTAGRSLPGSGDSTPNPGDSGMSRDNSSASKPDEGSRHKHKFSSSSHHHGHHHRRDKSFRKIPGELEEMDVREDLVSWQIGQKAFG